MDIKDLNTSNKTITLPMSEYIKLVEESDSSDYKKYEDITAKLLRAINNIQSTLVNRYQPEEGYIINNIFKENFKAVGYEVNQGQIIKIK